jgi:hypothetical protein
MAQQQVLQEAARLANQHQLGALQKKYSGNIGCMLILFIFFTYIVVSSIFFPVHAFSIAGLFSTAVLLLIVFAIFLRIYRFRHSRNFLYEHGYMIVKCVGKQIVASEAIHWREIAIIWHRVNRSTSSSRSSSGSSSTRTTVTHIYTLQRWNGTLFGSSIGNHEGKTLSGGLGKHIEQMTLPYLLPQAISTYQQGLPVHFGPLTLHTGGIEYQGSSLPWFGFDHLSMSEDYGMLSLRQKGGQRFLGFKKPWATLSYIQVPNLAVLHHLILSITGSSHP